MAKVYGQTWGDVGGASREISWRGIRALRANPPGLGGGNRHATFSTALEQAEQLFRAAATVTPAARPLPLFYGISQAGRALVAARASESWHIGGHGIREHRTSNRRGAPVAEFHIEPLGNGAFRMVADALGSSGLATPTRLGDLWPMLPESSRFPLPGMGDARLLAVRTQSMDRDGFPFHGTIRVSPQILPSHGRAIVRESAMTGTKSATGSPPTSPSTRRCPGTSSPSDGDNPSAFARQAPTPQRSKSGGRHRQPMASP